MSAIKAASEQGGDGELARVMLADESEAAINNQINVEYTNCYLYHAMASYFARDSVALHGFATYFRDQSDDERHHAQLFMDFLGKRGGRVQLGALSAPPSVRLVLCTDAVCSAETCGPSRQTTTRLGAITMCSCNARG